MTRRGLLLRAAAAGVGVAAFPRALAGASGRPRTGVRGGGVWLPGDLHVHSTYSHDVYGGPTDDNTGIEEAYTAGLPVAGKFLEARARGLKFLAVTDHNDVRSVADLGGIGGVIAIPGYEHSLKGHAQMLGTTTMLDPGDQAADAVAAMADRLRAEGGVFQANHPAYRMALDAKFEGCSPGGGCEDCASLGWSYGFDVRPDTVEVWNPSVTRNDASEAYWECWLDTGANIGATGGSDSHWLALHAIAGPGQPTTWVLAPEASTRGVLAGLRAGRTSVCAQPPSLGGLRLDLEAPGEGIVGDAVAPGTPLRVTAPGLKVPALLRVRANGHTVLERELDPGATASFRAPSEAGWVRALLLARVKLPLRTANDLGDPLPLRDGMPLLALTSAIRLRRPAAARRRRRSRSA